MIEVKVKAFASSFTEFDKRMALPLLKIGKHLAAAMMARVKRGQGAEGPMRPLGADADPSSVTRFWLAPERGGSNAPDENRIKDGKLAGWAVWRNYWTYIQSQGLKAPRDVEETGDFWRSVAVRANGPNRVKIAPYGTHRGPSGLAVKNTSIGYLASRGEPLPLLHPSRQEIVEAARIVFAEVDGQAIEAAAIAGVGFDARRQLASVQRRASKLLGD